jgi:hypothetical protein
MEREAVGLLCPHSLPFSISYKKFTSKHTRSPPLPTPLEPPYSLISNFFLFSFLSRGGAAKLLCAPQEEGGRSRSNTHTRSSKLGD